MLKYFSFLEAYDAGNIKTSEPKHRRWIRNYLLEDYCYSKKLVRRDSRREVVKKSVIFDKINDVHIASGHAGRDKIVKELSARFLILATAWWAYI